MCFACSVLSPAALFTATAPLPARLAVPATTVTPYFLNRKRTPRSLWSAILRLRPMTRVQSWRGLSAASPKASSSSLRKWYCSAARRSALLGMQPQFRQTPPRRSFSTQATFSLRCAARMAAR